MHVHFLCDFARSRLCLRVVSERCFDDKIAIYDYERNAPPGSK